MTIQQDFQKPVIQGLVELYTFDLTALGGTILRFTPNTVGGTAVVSFGGQAFQPLPVMGDGWETSIDGAPPRPKLKFSNITRFIQSFLTQYNDCIGATVTRQLTTETYLDSGATPDGTQIITQQVYLVNQLTKQNKYEVEFTLCSVLDAPNLKFPRKQVLRAEFPGAGLFRK